MRRLACLLLVATVASLAAATAAPVATAQTPSSPGGSASRSTRPSGRAGRHLRRSSRWPCPRRPGHHGAEDDPPRVRPSTARCSRSSSRTTRATGSSSRATTSGLRLPCTLNNDRPGPTTVPRRSTTPSPRADPGPAGGAGQRHRLRRGLRQRRGSRSRPATREQAAAAGGYDGAAGVVVAVKSAGGPTPATALPERRGVQALGAVLTVDGLVTEHAELLQAGSRRQAAWPHGAGQWATSAQPHQFVGMLFAAEFRQRRRPGGPALQGVSRRTPSTPGSTSGRENLSRVRRWTMAQVLRREPGVQRRLAPRRRLVDLVYGDVLGRIRRPGRAGVLGRQLDSSRPRPRPAS